MYGSFIINETILLNGFNVLLFLFSDTNPPKHISTAATCLDWSKAGKYFNEENIEKLNCPEIKTIKFNGIKIRKLLSLAPLCFQKWQMCESVNLSGVNFGEIKFEELLKLIVTLPKDLKKLILKNTNFEILVFEQKKRFFEVLPRGLIELDLSENNLSRFFDGMEKSQIGTFSNTFPPNIRILKLSNCNLGNENTSEKLWQETSFLINALPNIETLDLSNNQLSKIKPEYLITFFSLLPPSVRFLNLSANAFENFGEKALYEILRAIPKTIRLIHFSERCSFEKTCAEFKEKQFLEHEVIQETDNGKVSFFRKNNQIITVDGAPSQPLVNQRPRVV